MPIFADQILHTGARGLGILMGASGVGALGAFVLLASRQTVCGLGRWVATRPPRSAFQPYSLRGFALVLGFVCAAAAGGLRHDGGDGIVEHVDPRHGCPIIRGRVMACYSMMFMGMAPLGAVLAGFTAGRWGARNGGGGRRCLHRGCHGIRIQAAGTSRRRQATADQPGTRGRRPHGRATACRIGFCLQRLRIVCTS